MTAPERIRVAQDADGFWTCREAISGSQEYVRADIYEAALSVQPEAAVVGEPVDRDMIIVGDTAYPVDSEVCRAFNAFLIESFGERELLDALISADGLLRQLGHSLPNVKAAIAKADHRSTISAAPSAPDELRRIGAQMSNILFNLSQGGDIPERFRKQFRDLTREWDAALGGASHE